MGDRILQLRFRADAGKLKQVRRSVRESVRACGATEACADDVVMAVDEVCQNIIRHAYGGSGRGEIVLEIERSDDALVFRVTDFAPRVDPASVRPRDLDDVRPGGLGTHLIQQVMDSAEFIDPPPGCGNLFRMVKRIG